MVVLHGTPPHPGRGGVRLSGDLLPERPGRGADQSLALDGQESLPGPLRHLGHPAKGLQLFRADESGRAGAGRGGAPAAPPIEPFNTKFAYVGKPADSAHIRNWLDCIKSRGKCNADILIGHLSTSATLIGNIAHKTRSFLEWDGKTERFTNNAGANKFLEYHYRAPYKLG